MRRCSRRTAPGTAARTSTPRGCSAGRAGRPRGPRGDDGTACRRSRGTPQRVPRVYGCFGSWNTLSAGPSSTILPAYMIASRSETSTSTDRSWVMKSMERPRSCCSDFRSSQDLRLHHHVERRGGLVGDHQRRVACERHRDHHALLLAARELVRIVVDPAGRDHLLEQRARADAGLLPVRLARGPSSPPRSDRRPAAPGSRSAWHPGRRSRRRSTGAHGACRASARGRPARRARSRPRSRVFAEQPQDRGRDRGLAAARLAREPDHLSLRHVDVHAAHRRNVAALGPVRDRAGPEATRTVIVPSASG